jgi:probable DNA repair protein
MSHSSLGDAIAAGASIVTPNNRLAREIALRFDAVRLAAGERTWIPVHTRSWASWLEDLWLLASARGATRGRALLDSSAARELWHTIVTDDHPSLVDTRGAARYALDAWTTFHAWRDPHERIEQVVARAGDDDARCFGRWCDHYARRLEAVNAIDRPQLADFLESVAAASWTPSIGRVVLHGFVALTPSQQRLVAALRAQGVAIDESSIDIRPNAARWKVTCATPSAELVAALGFARLRLQEQPKASVGIVVANLEERREEVIALAEEILCPERLLRLSADDARPYDVSLGAPLSAIPIVAAAIDLIALAIGEIEAQNAAALLRSPFLPNATARFASRSVIERVWRSEGRHAVSWNDVIMALRAHDPALHARFSSIAAMSLDRRLPRDWAHAWSDWLDALGWPGDGVLASGEWQAREAWSNALAKFAATGMLTGAIGARRAFGSLSALLADTSWSPESAPAPVRILGVLEAAGLEFDAAWLVGFDAHRWPPAANANPFLPLTWQRSRGVPGAHPETALARAQALTTQLSMIGDEIVVSHAEHIDDAPSALSPLFAEWSARSVESLKVASTRWSDALRPIPLESIPDSVAPPVAAGDLRGGAGLFESQSACPFQAFARYRLQSQGWDACPDGLSAKERGTILHAVLTAFWDAVHEQRTLTNLSRDELMQQVNAAVESAIAKVPRGRWRTLPPAMAGAERRRLTATLVAWLDEVETKRPPFIVRSHESRIAFELEGIAVSARVDRIDDLEAGGSIIVDYKSGFVVRPVRWFSLRPEGIQLAVYARGLAAAGPEPIRALVYAQVKAGDIDIAGLADADDVWPGVEVAGTPRSRLPFADFNAARAQLDAQLTALAREIRTGLAGVTPRDRYACQYCELKPLCRIRTLDDPDNSADACNE